MRQKVFRIFPAEFLLRKKFSKSGGDSENISHNMSKQSCEILLCHDPNYLNLKFYKQFLISENNSPKNCPSLVIRARSNIVELIFEKDLSS